MVLASDGSIQVYGLCLGGNWSVDLKAEEEISQWHRKGKRLFEAGL